MTVLILTLGLLVLAAVLYRHFYGHPQKQSLTTLTSYGEIMDLLSRPKSNLFSRAAPNQRLVVAFSICNSFTTTDKLRHRAFSEQVAQHIKPTPADWQRTRALAQALLPPPTARTLHLVPFVQEFVLAVILGLFFPAHQANAADTRQLGRLIIDLWVASKCGRPAAAMRRKLAATMRRVFPGAGAGAADNPLNLILPAYETLWRVVLRCFLEIHFRGRDGWRELVAGYAHEPVDERFQRREHVSVEWIVKETLRLYPPTKRVYRETEQGLCAADIESLHLDPEVWGDDAREFRPERWGGDCCGTLMSFGAGWSVCPAGKTYAPRLIGILVGTILDFVPIGSKQSAGCAKDLVPKRGRLGNERIGYETLVLELNPSMYV